MASYEFGDDNRMIVDVNTGFLDRVFFQETWHIMENYIAQKSYGKPNPFANWKNLNPNGFSYNSSVTQGDNAYTVFDNTIPNDIISISSYAKKK